MQMTTTLRFHLTIVRVLLPRKQMATNHSKDMGEGKAVCSCAGGTINWYSHYGNQYGATV